MTTHIASSVNHTVTHSPFPLLSTVRRSDLTFKLNTTQGRHGWLRLTPAYSVKVVNDILSAYTQPMRILDPFSGTGTTPLSAAMLGHRALAIDINPFLVWLGNAKIATYDVAALSRAQLLATQIPSLVRQAAPPYAAEPPIHNIDRWWSKATRRFLCSLLGTIRVLCAEESPVRDLLLVAFCRTMIKLSNVAFNHQSMSFKSEDGPVRKFCHNSYKQACLAHFKSDIDFVLQTAAQNPARPATILNGDSRSLSTLLDEPVDLVITSPPYPNRMSYVRELRPYLYWLGYMHEARQAGEMDWQAIGGTWGIATSRVASWQPAPEAVVSPVLSQPLDRIRASATKSAHVLANYVAKYFDDVSRHVHSLIQLVTPGGVLHYIVGNSKFYDVVVPVEQIYRDIFLQAGAAKVEIVPLRKRNSKKELVEFDVVVHV